MPEKWIEKHEFALLWANGTSFSDLYDLIEAQVRKQVAIERAAADKLIQLEQLGDRVVDCQCKRWLLRPGDQYHAQDGFHSVGQCWPRTCPACDNEPYCALHDGV